MEMKAKTSNTLENIDLNELHSPLYNKKTFPLRKKKKKSKILIWLFIAITIFSILVAFSTSILALTYIFKNKKSVNKKVCTSEDCIHIASDILNSIDTSVDPCDDFYNYACGKWAIENVIPEHESRIALLSSPKNIDDCEATVKAKKLYASCMNTTQVDSVSVRSLKDLITYFGGWPILSNEKNKEVNVSLEWLLAELRNQEVSVLIESGVSSDDKNSFRNIIQIDQEITALSNKDYYVNTTNKEFLAYKALIYKCAYLLDAPMSTLMSSVDKVVEFERSLALIDWLKFVNYLKVGRKVTQELEVVLYAESYFKKLAEILKATPKEVIVNYAIWKLVYTLLPFMSTPFNKAHLNFLKVKLGIKFPPVRWEFCVHLVNKDSAMTWAVANLFIPKYFKPNCKDMALQMVENIREAFNELLHDVDWMDEKTLKVASEKANVMTQIVGFPEFILDKEKINEKWKSGPTVVNAFYSPNMNNIVIPAGILRPLFYSKDLPQALNYGGLGVVIGHEITHGFDAKGRQFDKDGNLKEWWNKATIEAFENRTKCIIDQYSEYSVEGLQVNGINTLGENIADNGGLKQSYRAYQKWLSKNNEDFLLPGVNLTQNQLFFLNYAQIWCGKMRQEHLAGEIKTAVHSPGEIRVLGPLSNSYDFAKAFKCSEKSRMNPPKKCSVW